MKEQVDRDTRRNESGGVVGTEARVAVVGATGAVGAEIMTVLNAAPWRPNSVTPFARPSTKIPMVAYGDEQLAVEDVDLEILRDFDLVFVATPVEAARELTESLGQHGAMVVDCSGVAALEGDAPLVIPWVNPEALASLEARDIVCVPGPAANLLASVGGPLVRAGLVSSLDATVLMPASCWGRDGLQELSSQVIALFNSGTPPRKIFPAGLAFDLLPEVGQRLENGATVGELMAETQLSRILGGELESAIRLVGVPLFSGVSAQVDIQMPTATDAALVSKILADGGAVLAEEGSGGPAATPRKVEGEPFVHVSRVRCAGHRLQLWATMDNLRAAATVAVANAGALLKRR
jgi:aspartate-semialdehyde dehydrogenase